MPLGRRDSTTASLSSANSDLPGPSSSLSALISSFSNKGFTAKELVALSGNIAISETVYDTFFCSYLKIKLLLVQFKWDLGV